MTHPAPGTMTTEQATECVAKMVAAYGEPTLIAGIERAMDSIAKLGREAVSNGKRGEKPARDYRLMWTAGREMRSTVLAAQAAVAAQALTDTGPSTSRVIGTVAPSEPKGDLSQLAELEERAAAGRYAIDGDDETPVRFYKIDVPETGKWAGYVFVKQVTGAVGEEGTRVRSPRARMEVLAAIEAAGPVEAEQRYGREIGRCSRCARLLTNEESRAYGIGPECRMK